ncbi:MAG TPA: hypothetical protein VKA70_20410 [Blastocatellia bacterium]|nr:hypothetical protein [Blastocatellia bacterium]
MRKPFVLLTVMLGIVMIGGASAGALADRTTGSAKLHPYNQSGVKGRINFVDTGTTLIVSGTATGLDPNNFYISLLYDVGSVPGGPLACEPSEDNTLTEDQMFAGIWTVAPDGTGTLNFTKSGPLYVPIRDVDTVSIRGEAEGFDRVACGEISRRP